MPKQGNNTWLLDESDKRDKLAAWLTDKNITRVAWLPPLSRPDTSSTLLFTKDPNTPPLLAEFGDVLVWDGTTMTVRAGS